MCRFTAPALIAALGLVASAPAALAQSTGQTAGQSGAQASGAQAAETRSGSPSAPRRAPARGRGSSTEMKTNGNPGVTPSGPYTSTDSESAAGGVTGANGPAESSAEVKAPPSAAPPGGAPSGGAGEAPNAEGGPH